MKRSARYLLTLILISVGSFYSTVASSDEPGFVVNSPGSPGATIVIDGTVDTVGEWAGITAVDIDYGMGDPLTAEVYALHKADGIYLGIIVQDSGFNQSDSIQLYFDLNHNHSMSPEASDWGVEINRNNTATWGAANTDPATWVSVPGGEFEVVDPLTQWSAEFRLPAGPPSNLVISDANVGVYFSIYNADLVFDPNSAKYTQWPVPVDLDNLLDDEPSHWGNYLFDPTSTFPDIAVTGVRKKSDVPENRYKISHVDDNTFEVQLNNPGGTAIPDASDVRVNLYLAARGIGESWHRLDTGAVLDGDCAAADWPSNLISKSEVCSGTASLDDISAQSLADIVSNTAKYTIKNGMPMTRDGGQSMTVAGGTNNWTDILTWNTTGAQDDRFKEVMVGGTTYRRQHQCMKAEAIVKNDPNQSNNLKQVNMDFVTISALSSSGFFFNAGWAGFGKYDWNQGKYMYLQVDMKNMNPKDGWKYDLQKVERLGENKYKTRIIGKESQVLQMNITAPSPSVMGKTLKENLVIAAKAGGRHANAGIPSGDSPVYVKVEAGSTLWISNYAFHEKDRQYVDLDGEGFLPSNGPEGLSTKYLNELIEKVDEKYRILMAPHIPLGSLIGSFDNFRTAFKIGGGVQVKVPANARYLALAVNDLKGLYSDNAGTGFRVKVVQRAGTQTQAGTEPFWRTSFVKEAYAADESALQTIPLSEVIPTLCVNGYEDIGEKRNLGGKDHKLYRYIGNVCWGITNVYPRDRSEKPDQGDVYEEEVSDKPENPVCGRLRKESLAFSSVFTFFGLVAMRRGISRRKKRE